MIILFKLINTSAIFQIYIDNVLREYLNIFVIIYLDNILVYLKNKINYKVHIRKILKALKKVDLRIKLKKSQFH